MVPDPFPAVPNFYSKEGCDFSFGRLPAVLQSFITLSASCFCSVDCCLFIALGPILSPSFSIPCSELPFKKKCGIFGPILVINFLIPCPILFICFMIFSNGLQTFQTECLKIIKTKLW